MVTQKTKTKATGKTKKKATPAAESVSADTQATAPLAKHRGKMIGLVVSDKMQKTIVVRVDRKVRDRLYKKYVNHSTRFQAHDENNEAKVGDLVAVIESRPLSKHKRWALHSILRKGGQAPELNVTV